jgi:hypothetical protein
LTAATFVALFSQQNFSQSPTALSRAANSPKKSLPDENSSPEGLNLRCAIRPI